MKIGRYIATGAIIAGLSGVGHAVQTAYKMNEYENTLKTEYPQVTRFYEIESALEKNVKRQDILEPGFIKRTTELTGERDELKRQPDFSKQLEAYDKKTADLGNKTAYAVLEGVGSVFLYAFGVAALTTQPRRQRDESEPYQSQTTG